MIETTFSVQHRLNCYLPIGQGTTETKFTIQHTNLISTPYVKYNRDNIHHTTHKLDIYPLRKVQYQHSLYNKQTWYLPIVYGTIETSFTTLDSKTNRTRLLPSPISLLIFSSTWPCLAAMSMMCWTWGCVMVATSFLFTDRMMSFICRSHTSAALPATHNITKINSI